MTSETLATLAALIAVPRLWRRWLLAAGRIVGGVAGLQRARWTSVLDVLSKRRCAAHGCVVAVERGGGALAAAVEARAVAQADLICAELVQAVEREEGGFIAHFD